MDLRKKKTTQLFVVKTLSEAKKSMQQKSACLCVCRVIYRNYPCVCVSRAIYQNYPGTSHCFFFVSDGIRLVNSY